MRKAAIYCRISLDSEGEAAGVKRQEKDCRALAAQLGWEVVAVHTDNSVSAYSKKRRPAYQALLADLSSGAADALIVWKPDRLHRRPVELEHFIDVVEQHKIEVRTVAGGQLDLTTSEGRAMARVVGAFARMESEVKSDRQRRKHAALAEEGVAVGGGRPFGFEADKVTVRVSEATLVREAADRVLSGGTVRGVAQDWNRRGLETPRGNRWSQTAIRRVLTSWRIAGVRSLGGNPVAYDAWPALIDAESHARLRAILLAPGRSPGGYGPRTHVLTGLLRCWRCDHKLIARPQSNRRRTYVCTSNPDVGGCGGVRIVADDLEQFVVELLAAHIDGPSFAAAVRGADDDDDPLLEIRVCEGKLRDLAEMWANDEITRESWLDTRRAVEARLADARRRLAAPIPILPGEGASILERWEHMQVDQRHGLLAMFIDRITIGRATPGHNRFDPSRISVHWRV